MHESGMSVPHASCKKYKTDSKLKPKNPLLSLSRAELTSGSGSVPVQSAGRQTRFWRVCNHHATAGKQLQNNLGIKTIKPFKLTAVFMYHGEFWESRNSTVPGIHPCPCLRVWSDVVLIEPPSWCWWPYKYRTNTEFRRSIPNLLLWTLGGSTNVLNVSLPARHRVLSHTV